MEMFLSFSSPYFGFSCFSIHARRNPEICLNSRFSRGKILLTHVGSSDYLWPNQLRPESQGVIVPTDLLGPLPSHFPQQRVYGLGRETLKFYYRTFGNLTIFPVSDLMVMHLCFWLFPPHYPHLSLSTDISSWQSQRGNGVKCFPGTHQWDLANSEGLLPRYEHASFVPSCAPHTIWVFGGADQSGNRNCLQVLNPGK